MRAEVGFLLLLHLGCVCSVPVPTEYDDVGSADSSGTTHFEENFRKIVLEDILDKLHGTGKDKQRIDMEGDVDSPTREVDSSLPGPDVDATLPGVWYNAPVPLGDTERVKPVSKRYYSRRRNCSLSRISAATFVEYLRTGRICGNRITHVRFGLTGRK